MRRALALCVVAACGGDEFVIVPQIDMPAGEDVLAGVDRMKLLVKHANAPEDAPPIDSREFKAGQTLELGDIPFSDDIVIELQGFRGSSTPTVGGRTCPFKLSPNDDPPAPHLYLSELGSVGTIDLSTEIRVNGAALASVDNTVVLLGGDNISTFETFDPLSAAKLPTPAEMLESRFDATIARVGAPGGPRPAVIGGLVDGVFADNLEILDVKSGEVGNTLDNAHLLARGGAVATELTDGKVLVTGGKKDDPTTPTPDGVATADITVINVVDSMNSAELQPKSAARFARVEHAAVRMGDNDGAPVLIVGGADRTGTLVSEAELFLPLRDQLDDGFQGKVLQVPRRKLKAVVVGDNSAVIIGGLDANGRVDKLERFSFIDGSFQTAGTLPKTAGAIEFSVTPLPDGRVLLTGGRQSETSPAVATVFLLRFDPKTDTITIEGDEDRHLATPRARHQAVLLCDGTVLITGGTGTTSPAERYNAIVFKP